MKKFCTRLSIILIVISASVIFSQCGSKNNKEKAEEIHQGLIITAKQLNARAPEMIDDVTRLDKSEAKGNELISYYTILAETKNINKKAMEGLIIKNLKANPETVALSQSDVTYTFVYRDANGTVFHSFSVKASDLK